MGLLIEGAEELGGPEGQVVRAGNIPGEKRTVGDERGAEEHADGPGQQDADQFAPPEGGLSLPLQHHGAKIAGDEEHHRHDVDIGGEYHQIKEGAVLGIVDIPPFQIPGGVAHGYMKDDHEQDDEGAQIIEKKQALGF